MRQVRQNLYAEQPIARCAMCGASLRSRAIHPVILADGAFEFWHWRQGYRCLPVIVDRFPTRPPATPPGADLRPAQPCSLRQRLRAYERALLVWALRREQYHSRRAARLLGCRWSTFRNKVRRHGGRQALLEPS